MTISTTVSDHIMETKKKEIPLISMEPSLRSMPTSWKSSLDSSHEVGFAPKPTAAFRCSSGGHLGVLAQPWCPTLSRTGDHIVAWIMPAQPPQCIIIAREPVPAISSWALLHMMITRAHRLSTRDGELDFSLSFRLPFSNNIGSVSVQANETTRSAPKQPFLFHTILYVDVYISIQP